MRRRSRTTSSRPPRRATTRACPHFEPTVVQSPDHGLNTVRHVGAVKKPITSTSGANEPHARILIVEDQAVIAEDLTEMLDDWGYLVAGVARSCDEALLMLESETPDLVLMDIDFHGEKSGLLATLRIQKDLRVPVVYVTGCTSEDLGPALAMTDPRGFVSKPIDPDRLAAVIRRALRGPGRLSSS